MLFEWESLSTRCYGLRQVYESFGVPVRPRHNPLSISQRLRGCFRPVPSTLYVDLSSTPSAASLEMRPCYLGKFLTNMMTSSGTPSSQRPDADVNPRRARTKLYATIADIHLPNWLEQLLHMHMVKSPDSLSKPHHTEICPSGPRDSG